MKLIGKKTVTIKRITPKEITCPNCNSNNTTTVSILGVYKHLFYIPFLSGGKHGVSICSNCNHSFDLKNMPSSIKLSYFEIKELVKTPIWFYSGFIGIKVLVLIKIFSRFW